VVAVAVVAATVVAVVVSDDKDITSRPAERTASARPPDTVPGTPVPTASEPPTPDGVVSAKIQLPSRTLVLGSTMAGTVVVTNRTGEAVTVKGCMTWVQVVLTEPGATPTAPWRACLQIFTIPVGQSSWPAELLGFPSSCSQGSPDAPCGADGRPAGFAPGDYVAQLVQSEDVALAPAPIPIRVVP
jgi:hypothetical protein